VDAIFSGPLPTLDKLKPSDVQVVIDLSNYTEGTYQIEPKVEVDLGTSWLNPNYRLRSK
jgi:YbbR domain-containing protein